MRTVTVSKSMIQDFKHSPQPQLKLKLKKKFVSDVQLVYGIFEVKLRNIAKSCERLLDI